MPATLESLQHCNRSKLELNDMVKGAEIMFNKRSWWLKSVGMAVWLPCLMLGLDMQAWACDIAVVSGRVSTTGRPFIWKNFDSSQNWHQQVQFFPAQKTGPGGYLMVYRFEDGMRLLTGSPITPSAGVNESGFAMAITSVYEEYNPVHTATDLSTELMRDALEQCQTLSDFERLVKNWHWSHFGCAVSCNAAVIDAKGGAAMYELFTGYVSLGFMPIRYKKYDANSGKVVNNAGRVLNAGQGNAFIGFHVRTNYNDYCPWNVGADRRVRAEALMTRMAGNKRLSYQNVMREVSKDVEGKQVSSTCSQTNYSTMYCISRACTRSGIVVDGVANGGDPRLSVFWCVLGEPSIGCYVPYFVAAKGVSYLAYADKLVNGVPGDQDDASFLCLAEDARETYHGLIYSSNRGTTAQGMYDNYINKVELGLAQKWTFEIENTVIYQTEAFLRNLRDDAGLITMDDLRDFSDYSAEYTYENYIAGSSSAMPWSYTLPE